MNTLSIPYPYPLHTEDGEYPCHAREGYGRECGAGDHPYYYNAANGIASLVATRRWLMLRNVLGEPVDQLTPLRAFMET